MEEEEEIHYGRTVSKGLEAEFVMLSGPHLGTKWRVAKDDQAINYSLGAGHWLTQSQVHRHAVKQPTAAHEMSMSDGQSRKAF